MSDGITMKVEGLAELTAELKLQPASLAQACAAALYQEAEAIMAVAKRIVPKKWGALQSSGIVLQPTTDQAGMISVKLGFGGPSAPYALIQHENLSYKHKGGRVAKYLEGPLLARTSNQTKQTLRNRIVENFNRITGHK